MTETTSSHNIEFGNIPQVLTDLNQWVMWKTVIRDGKDTKKPFTVFNTAASPTNPSDWTSFDNAVSTFDATQYSGIGFVFTSNNDLCGIDLDGCRDPQTGIIADWAEDEILRFSSYTEISPSRTGLKIWIYCDSALPKGRKKEIRRPQIVAKMPAVEVYSQGRYFAMTGQVHKRYNLIERREAQLQEFLSLHWPDAPAIDRPASDWRSDDAVVERARKYLERVPGAVSGSGGHNATFHVACVVVKGFALPEAQALDVLTEWNSKCVPPWSEHELRHKIQSAGKASGETGYLRNSKPERYDDIQIPKYQQPATKDIPRIDFEIIDSKTFAETDYRVQFLIQDIMADGQPQLYSGPSKTLKTSILVDQCLSLSSATPFLGRFDVPKTKRCLLLSSESGTATLQETAKRICQAKSISLAELGDNLHWGFRPPQLTDAQHIATLTDFVLRNKIDVVGIDPAYLSMDLQGNAAANQFAVGAVLSNLTTLQADTGCTPILAAHFRMHMLPGVMPTLDHIAGAGFGQWARQWVLLNRREEFNPDEPGTHRLLFAFGGSAGHCGAYGLDISEGRTCDGRFWNVDLNSLSQIREDKETEKESKTRDKQNRAYENNRARILATVRRFPNGETKTQIRTSAGLNPPTFEPVFQDLLSSMEVEPCDVQKTNHHGNLKTYQGFRLASKEIEELRRTSKNSEEQFFGVL